MKTLHEIGEYAGTDKGRLHGYLDIYEKFLSPLRDKPITLLEIGVGSGHSIKMWLEYFPLARVCGIDCLLYPDIDRDLLNHPRFRHITVCQQDEVVFRMFPKNAFDVIVDDGSHEYIHQILSFHYLWSALKSGGYYFIEDLQSPEYFKFWTMMPEYEYWEHNTGHASRLVKVRKGEK